MKPWMFTNVQLIRTENGRGIRFYWKLQGEDKPNYIDNPSIEWLLDFISEANPYELHDAHDWDKAFNRAIACAAEEEISAQLKEKGMLTDNELTEIIEKTYNTYFPAVGKWRLFKSEDFIFWLDLKIEKTWKMKGE